MQFESKQKRTVWVNLALGSVPDILIAALIASVMDGGAIGFIVALVGLQVLYFLIWAKNSIWAWVVFLINGRKAATSHFRHYLETNKFPEPEDYERSPDGYFSKIVEDENQPVDIRLKAAASLAELNYIASQSQMQNYLRLSMAYEDAIEDHKRSFK
jgi:hypothetical protein